MIQPQQDEYLIVPSSSILPPCLDIFVAVGEDLQAKVHSPIACGLRTDITAPPVHAGEHQSAAIQEGRRAGGSQCAHMWVCMHFFPRQWAKSRMGNAVAADAYALPVNTPLKQFCRRLYCAQQPVQQGGAGWGTD